MNVYNWNDNKMNFEYLLKTEQNTFKDTYNKKNEIITVFINLINTFYRIHYHLKPKYEKESYDHKFYNLSEQIYLRLPYSLRSINILWPFGYYQESLLIFRQLLESFVILRYFNNHRDEIEPHFTATGNKGRIQFRQMFSEFSDDLYKNYYGKVFSNIAHGGIYSFLFRTEYSSPSNGKILLGCQYDNKNSNLIIIPTLTLSYGYLNYIDIFYPDNNIKSDSFLSEKVIELVNYLEINILSDYKNDFIMKAKTLVMKS